MPKTELGAPYPAVTVGSFGTRPAVRTLWLRTQRIGEFLPEFIDGLSGASFEEFEVEGALTHGAVEFFYEFMIALFFRPFKENGSGLVRVLVTGFVGVNARTPRLRFEMREADAIGYAFDEPARV